MNGRMVLRDVLRAPNDYEWTMHGLGMMRCYLDAERTVRLNLWHRALKTPGVSMLHTHPWALRSDVVCGVMTNYRYDRVEVGGEPYNEAEIACGPAYRGIENVKGIVYLSRRGPEHICMGMFYEQAPHEIHESDPLDGTATIMHRGPENGLASIFWPEGSRYGDASRPWDDALARMVLRSVRTMLDI